MNYLAQGLSEGFDSGMAMAAAKRKRKQEEEDKFLDRQLQLDSEARRENFQRSLQEQLLNAQGEQLDKRLSADALAAAQGRGQRNKEQESTQTFTADQNQAGRTERSSESSLNRDLQRELARQQADTHALQAATQNQLNERQLKLHERQVNFETDPESPRNKYWQANAQMKETDAQMLGGPQLTQNGLAAKGIREGQKYRPPPPEAIQFLLKNPQLKDQFDEQFGRGAAAKYLNSIRSP